MGNITMPLTLDDLHGGEGAHREGKRVGRGHGSGKGKTAGRGTKGQKSRSGPGVRRGFEGGQLPIQQRMPYKRGFTNIYRTPWEVVNLGRLEAVEVDGPITPEVLFAKGVTRGLEFPVKILAGGELTRPVVIHAHAFSDAARSAVEQLGGSITELERTDEWIHAKPRSRRLPLNRELKQARVGKVGGPTRREAIAALAESREG
jgi:large subunit ribosomal protein L15